MDDVKLKPFLSQISDIFKYKIIPLPPLERMAILAVAAHSDATGKCTIALKTIADYIGVNRKNVVKYINRLAARNIFTVKENKIEELKIMKENTYTINIHTIIKLSIDGKGVLTVQEEPKTDAQKEEGGAILQGGGVPSQRGEGCHPTGGVKNRSTLQAHNKLRDIARNESAQVKNDSNVHSLNQPDKFSEFYALYPRKQDRKRAKQVWDRKGLDDQFEIIRQDILNRVAKDVQWRQKEFIPMASTYLNNERWNDEIVEESDAPKQKDKFDSATWLLNGVKDDYAKQGRSTSNISDVSNYLAKKVDG